MNKKFDHVEISDLIEESVANAALRRQQIVDDVLIEISEAEAKNIEGGKQIYPLKPYCSFDPHCPFIIGIVIIEPNVLTI
ncbi:MAG: hypothetical protein AAGF26_15765 [Cyanobacteria bacterium P01_G01_bin.49]